MNALTDISTRDAQGRRGRALPAWLETFDDEPAKACAAPLRRHVDVLPERHDGQLLAAGEQRRGRRVVELAAARPALASKKNMLVLHGVGNYSAFGPATSTVPIRRTARTAPAPGTARPAQGHGQPAGRRHLRRPGHREPNRRADRSLPSLQVDLSTLDSFATARRALLAQHLVVGAGCRSARSSTRRASSIASCRRARPRPVGATGMPAAPNPMLAQTHLEERPRLRPRRRDVAAREAGAGDQRASTST